MEVQSEESKSRGRAVREKGDPSMVGSVSAPMSGDVIDIKIKAGENLKPASKSTSRSSLKNEKPWQGGKWVCFDVLYNESEIQCAATEEDEMGNRMK